MKSSKNLLTGLFTIAVVVGNNHADAQQYSRAKALAGSIRPAPLPPPARTAGNPSGPYPFRKIDDKFCDLRALFIYRNTPSLQREQLKNPMPAWNDVSGEIVNVRSGVLIVQRVGYRNITRSNGGTPGSFSDRIVVGSKRIDGPEFAIKNHPEAAKFAKGNRIQCLAIKTGTFDYQGDTIELYDHGIPFSPIANTNTVKLP